MSFLIYFSIFYLFSIREKGIRERYIKVKEAKRLRAGEYTREVVSEREG